MPLLRALTPTTGNANGRYVESIRGIAEKAGIAKIVPPDGWKPGKTSFGPHNEKVTPTKRQEVRNLINVRGTAVSVCVYVLAFIVLIQVSICHGFTNRLTGVKEFDKFAYDVLVGLSLCLVRCCRCRCCYCLCDGWAMTETIWVYLGIHDRFVSQARVNLVSTSQRLRALMLLFKTSK